ncbi:hypothetical protein BS17DRAFT_767572 [Gyrodon lividus]|nr:hypothetical protein BS17DRAFT_767572 [Gyrodon lividus]
MQLGPDDPDTPNLISHCYKKFVGNQGDIWRDILKVFELTEMTKTSDHTIGQHSQTFNRLHRKICHMLDTATAKYGFEAMLVMCSNIVNEDSSLGHAHATTGATKASHTPLVKFWETRCRANPDTIIGHFKVHIYNVVSLDVVSKAFDRDVNNMNGCENACGVDVTKLKGINFPWKMLLAFLVEKGLVIEGYPNDVLMPSELCNPGAQTKGINNLMLAEKHLLVAAIRTGKLVIRHAWDSCEHDGKINWKGLPQLVPSLATTQVRWSSGKTKTSEPTPDSTIELTDNSSPPPLPRKNLAEVVVMKHTKGCSRTPIVISSDPNTGTRNKEQGTGTGSESYDTHQDQDSRNQRDDKGKGKAPPKGGVQTRKPPLSAELISSLNENDKFPDENLQKVSLLNDPFWTNGMPEGDANTVTESLKKHVEGPPNTSTTPLSPSPKQFHPQHPVPLEQKPTQLTFTTPPATAPTPEALVTAPSSNIAASSRQSDLAPPLHNAPAPWHGGPPPPSQLPLPIAPSTMSHAPGHGETYNMQGGYVERPFLYPQHDPQLAAVGGGYFLPSGYPQSQYPMYYSGVPPAAPPQHRYPDGPGGGPSTMPFLTRMTPMECSEALEMVWQDQGSIRHWETIVLKCIPAKWHLSTQISQGPTLYPLPAPGDHDKQGQRQPTPSSSNS